MNNADVRALLDAHPETAPNLMTHQQAADFLNDPTGDPYVRKVPLSELLDKVFDLGVFNQISAAAVDSSDSNHAVAKKITDLVALQRTLRGDPLIDMETTDPNSLLALLNTSPFTTEADMTAMGTLKSVTRSLAHDLGTVTADHVAAARML